MKFRSRNSQFASDQLRGDAFVRALLVLVVLVFGALSAASGQSTATVDGIVHDATGALVPKAKAELKNTATGKSQATVTNRAGVFSFSGVNTGDYELYIEAQGFARSEFAAIHLNPGDQRTFSEIKLNAGSDETVVVTSDTGQVATDSGETNALISAEDIDHLAVEGRDVTELLKILPGMAIVTNGTTFANAAYDPSIVSFGGAIGSYSGNGTQANSTSILSDGMDITDPGSYGLAIQNVNYDQVAEVKVTTGSFTADTAHGPVVINAIGKAGGDVYHGSLYVYGRTYQLNDIDWIAKYSHEPAPHDRQIYPGFTIGGPVRIPGLGFNRSKKLTFFAGAEEYAQRSVYAYNSAYAATVSALVPTAGMRNGDFSDTQLNAFLGVGPNGPNRVLNTAAGVTPANCNSTSSLPCYVCPLSIYVNICAMPLQGPGGFNGDPLVNGYVSPTEQAKYDPQGLGKRIYNALPLPNVASNGSYNYITTDFVNSNLYQVKTRLDYALSEKTHMFLAYSVESGLQYQPSLTYGRPGPNGQGGGLDTLGGGFTGTATSHVASLEVTSVITPSLTNQAYAGGAYFSQIFNLRTPSANQGEPYSLLFNNGSTALPSLQTYGASTSDGFPFWTVEDPTFGNDFTKKQLRLGGDNVTKLIQRHTFRAGIFYQWVDNPQVQSGQNTNGSLSDYYHPTSFTDYDGSVVASTGNYTADLLEGIIGGVSQTNKKVETNLYFFSLSAYVQDHWLVSRHMSIDAGVRLEHFTPWLDPHGQGVAVFDATAYASGANLASPGVLYHAIDASIPLSGVPTRPAFVDPRFGFVYDFRGDSKTILRAGYGVYRQHDSYNDGLLSAQTAEGQRSYSTTKSGHTFRNLVINQGNVTSASSGFIPDSSIYTRMAGDDEMSRVQTYNLVLDQRLPHSSAFEIAYVGNDSNHLMEANNLRNINAMPYGTLYKPQPNTGRIDTASTVGMVWPIFAPANNLGNGNLANLTTADTDSFRPYPLYSSIYAIRHRGYANYNSLQTRYSWTPRHARISANYTWSKALGAVAGPDPINLRNDYLPLSIDRTNILNLTYSYTFGNLVQERYLGWVTNGWEISGITNYQSGPVANSFLSSNFGLYGSLILPVGTVASVPGYNNTSTCVASGTPATCSLQITSSSSLGTPDIALQPTIVASARGTAPHQYVNGSVFRLPPLGTNGPTYYGDLRGPAYFNSDLSMRKEFKLREKNLLQLRIAAFNFINRANYTFSSLYSAAYAMNFNQTATSTNLNSDLVNATNQSPGFGSAPIRTGRRVMEISIKYVF